MSALAPSMTADAFLAWAMEQPDGMRHELVAGEVVAMSPERASHGRAKGRLFRLLSAAIEAAGLPCEVFVDGMAVEVDAATVYEPDVVVRCGTSLSDEAVKITDPLIVVEVLSPSTRARDAGAKLEDYFRLPSVRHYLIVKTENRSIVHYARDAEGGIAARTVHDGALELDPPGIALRNVLG